MKFKDIDEARRLLRLGETASLKEIRLAFQNLAHQYHPDKHGGSDAEKNEMMKKLNRAYKVLTDYCDEYRYSFRQEDIHRGSSKEDEYDKWRDNWSF